MRQNTSQISSELEAELLPPESLSQENDRHRNIPESPQPASRVSGSFVESQVHAATSKSEALTISRIREGLATAPTDTLTIHTPHTEVQWWSESFQTVLEHPPSMLPFRLILGGIAFLCIFSLWAVFGRIEEVGQAQGKLVPEGETFKVQPSEAGTVVNIAIEEGEIVERGQLIAELDSQVAQAEVERLQEVLASYRQQLEQNQLTTAELARENQSRLEIANAMVDAQTVVLEQNQREILATRELLSLQELEIASHRDRLENLRPSFDEGVISREYLFGAEQAYSERMSANTLSRGDLERLVVETQKLQAELDQKQAEVDRIQSESHQRMQELEVKATQLQADVAETETHLNTARVQLDLLFLRSPVDGVVSALNIRNIGEVAQQGETLAEVAPEEAPLILVAALPDREAGFIEVGMPAQIKLDAFPYQDFGIIRGTVNSVSPDTENHEEMGAVYQVEISLEQTHIFNNGHNIDLKAGQTGQAEIIIRQQRIIDVLLDPIQRLQGDGLSM